MGWPVQSFMRRWYLKQDLGGGAGTNQEGIWKMNHCRLRQKWLKKPWGCGKMLTTGNTYFSRPFTLFFLDTHRHTPPLPPPQPMCLEPREQGNMHRRCTALPPIRVSPLPWMPEFSNPQYRGQSRCCHYILILQTKWGTKPTGGGLECPGITMAYFFPFSIWRDADGIRKLYFLIIFF